MKPVRVLFSRNHKGSTSDFEIGSGKGFCKWIGNRALKDEKRIFALLLAACFAIGVFAKPAILVAGEVPETVPNVLRSASELDYPPFATVLDDGSADGFSVELLKAVTRPVDFVQFSKIRKAN